MDKRIDTIPKSTVERLKHHPWPGNVRELQNFIERAVILTTGSILNAPLGDLKTPAGAEPIPAVTLREAESSHILKTLPQTNWVLVGPRGAALRLGLTRSTLATKIPNVGLYR